MGSAGLKQAEADLSSPTAMLEAKHAKADPAKDAKAAPPAAADPSAAPPSAGEAAAQTAAVPEPGSAAEASVGQAAEPAAEPADAATTADHTAAEMASATCVMASFPAEAVACQADALADIGSVEGYVDWMRGLFTPIPDGQYEVKSFSTDEGRSVVTVFDVFKGTQTGAGPLDPPTGKSVSTDYVYAMHFDGDKIRHMTKIWNDVRALQELGWA